MILDLMHSRRSVRRFQPRLPQRELLARLVEAAVTAPSAGNRQPWRFLVITNRQAIAQLASAVREAAERIAGHVAPGFREPFRAYGENFTRFEAAPAVIAPLYRSHAILSQMLADGLPEADRQAVSMMEAGSGIIGTSMAMQNLLLMAHASGLGASVMTGPLIARDRVRAILEVPGSWEVLALVAVGYRAEDPTPPPRKEADKVTRWIT